jgi:3-oxoacyl-[acyl-carrier-protein] synthase-1
MQRVAITGYGIISSLGNNRHEVARALREGRSGIEAVPEYAEKGFRSRVAGTIKLDPAPLIDRKLFRFMGNCSAYAYLALREAIEHAGLQPGEVSHDRTGLVVGLGGLSAEHVHDTIRTFETRGARKVGPYMVPRTMASCIAANLATAFHIRGVNYSLSSACASGAHSIGHAADLIRLGRQDVMFAGAGDELYWTITLMFDAMGALASRGNDHPAQASRPYDAHRDGFVISGGAGMVVLENWERARARGAPILGELVGFGATSDGADMVAPSGEGALRCMRQALAEVREPVDYVNTHGTSTPAGDITELNAVRACFGERMPHLSSTKALTGHALGAAGAHEAIYCLMMMEGRYLAASHHIQELDPAAVGAPILRHNLEDFDCRIALSNSFGFGGTNACLVLRKPD